MTKFVGKFRKNKEYNEMLDSKFQDLKVFMKIEIFGEDSLTKDERKRYDRLMDKEINEKNHKEM